VSAYDVLIVGGGLIGSSIAFELSSEKLRVAVLDCQEPGREASWAAAGMLSPGPDSSEASALVPLGIESLCLYPEFISAVESASGKATDFTRNGTFEVFRGPEAEIARNKMVAEFHHMGLAAAAMSANDARKHEPSLAAQSGAVAWLPEEATVDPRLLIEAVLAAAKQSGAEIRANCAVDTLLYEGKACAGVISSGQKFAAKQVIIAAGSFCATIANGAVADGAIAGAELTHETDPHPQSQLCQYAPVHPVRGQMLALRSTTVQLKKVLRSQHGYLVPRRDGRIIAGSTLEDAGFVKKVTPEGIRQILDAALELAPALADAKIVEEWCGLRPGTPDQLPIIGPTDVPGLWLATGHYRNGILLAPATAKIMRDWIVTGKSNFKAESFSPLRFTIAKSQAHANRGSSRSCSGAL
jgi:glycine oxidase